MVTCPDEMGGWGWLKSRLENAWKDTKHDIRMEKKS